MSCACIRLGNLDIVLGSVCISALKAALCFCGNLSVYSHVSDLCVCVLFHFYFMWSGCRMHYVICFSQSPLPSLSLLQSPVCLSSPVDIIASVFQTVLHTKVNLPRFKLLSCFRLTNNSSVVTENKIKNKMQFCLKFTHLSL